MSLCSVISADAYQQGSPVVLLAVQNQFLQRFKFDNDGSAAGRAAVAATQAIVDDQLGVVRAKYGNVPNITWRDFTSCPSLSPVLDSSGTPTGQFKNFDREELMSLGYMAQPKYFAGSAPLSDNSLMQKAVKYVPLSMDTYFPPQVSVILFILVVVLAVAIVLMMGGDDESQAPPQMYPSQVYSPQMYATPMAPQAYPPSPVYAPQVYSPQVPSQAYYPPVGYTSPTVVAATPPTPQPPIRQSPQY